VAIRQVTNAQGKVLCQFTPRARIATASSRAGIARYRQQVITPEHAYLITSILADKRALPGVRLSNMLELGVRLSPPRTGTTNDYKDNWTLGYTPDLVVGVWSATPTTRR